MSNIHQVSIICPVYNAERYLNETVASVVAQTYSQWELLLVIDNKSSDRSLELGKDWASKDPRIKVIESAENRGVANNRNHGIRIANGDYIAFIDSDDLWLPEKLERQLDFMVKDQIEFSCHDYQQMAADGSLLPIKRQCAPRTTYKDLLKNNVIGCLTVMIRTPLIKQFSFKEQTPHEDFVLWLEILRKIPEVRGLNLSLARYRVLPNSRSGDKKRAAFDRWYLYRKILGLSLLESIYYFTCYAVTAIWVRAFPRPH